MFVENRNSTRQFIEPKGSSAEPFVYSEDFETHAVWDKSLLEILVVENAQFLVRRVGQVLVLAGPPRLKRGASLEAAMQKLTQSQPGMAVCGYYFPQSFKQSNDINFSFHQLGVSHYIDLSKQQYQGYAKRDSRRAYNHQQRSELNFSEVLSEEFPDFFKQAFLAQERWRLSRKQKEMGFLLNRITRKRQPGQRWFAVRDKQSKLLAFADIHSFGEDNRSWYMDQMVQVPGENRFALDILISQVIAKLRDESQKVLSLGLSPFQDLPEAETWTERFFKLQGMTDVLYNSRGIHLFKGKFSDETLPMYAMTDDRFPLWKQARALYKVTFENK